MIIRRRAALTAMAALGVAAVSAGAWETPIRIDEPSQYIDGPRMATDHAGNAVMVWARGRYVAGQSGELPGESVVEAAARPSGSAAWGGVHQVSPVGQRAYFPVAAMLPGGAGLASWFALGPTGGLRESVQGAGGAWGPERPASNGFVFDDAWAVGEDGTIASAWTTGSGTGTASVSVMVRDPAGAWSAPASLGNVAEGAQPVVAVAADGTVTAVLHRPRGRAEALVATVRGADGIWGPDIHLADVQLRRFATTGARAVISPTGELVVVWADISLPRDRDWMLRAVVLDQAGGTRTLTLGARGAPPFRLLTGPAGVRAVWQGIDGRVRIAGWAQTGGWRAPVAVPASLVCRGGNIAAAATGVNGTDVLVLAQDNLLKSVIRRPDGSWSVPMVVSGPRIEIGRPVAAAVTGDRIQVAWTRQQTVSRTVLEVTSTSLGDADTAGVAQDVVPRISDLHVVRRAGRVPAAVFTLSRPARVSLQVPVRPVRDVSGRRGRNVVPLHLTGGGLPSGRVAITATAYAGQVGGCPVTKVVRLP